MHGSGLEILRFGFTEYQAVWGKLLFYDAGCCGGTQICFRAPGLLSKVVGL